MPIWFWIIVVTIVLGAVAAIIAALRRKRPVEVDRAGLSRVEADRLQGELEASKAAERAVAAEKASLQAKLKQNQVWYNDRLQANKKEVRDEERRLANNPDELDLKLDQLLGSSKEDSG
jgi:hypothetical protein